MLLKLTSDEDAFGKVQFGWRKAKQSFFSRLMQVSYSSESNSSHPGQDDMGTHTETHTHLQEEQEKGREDIGSLLLPKPVVKV